MPPESSSGVSLLVLALAAISLTSVAIYSRPLRLILRKTGAIKPLSVCTAKLMFTFLNYRTKSPYHDEFV